MPLVSVIVPLYNKAPYVLRALESVAAQTVEDLEVIAVDDGSTDGGDEIVSRFPDSRFRLIRQPNAGPGAARNRGLREARAPYVGFLDADDRWLPQFLAENVSILERYPTAAAVCCGWHEDPGGAFPAKWWRDCHTDEALVTLSPRTRVEDLVGMIAYTNPSTILARTQSVARWGGFYEAGSRYGEDATLYLKMFLNEPFYFHPRQLRGDGRRGFGALPKLSYGKAGRAVPTRRKHRRRRLSAGAPQAAAAVPQGAGLQDRLGARVLGRVASGQ